MQAKRILFVDDEEGLRLTLPAILELHGFQVRSAATVAEALAEITTRTFDVLISDLNIGEPGDGFTVVSAMRRTQPECCNIIITGFPAFETALSAIQRQVDVCLVKPARVQQLVELIRNRADSHQPSLAASPQRLSGLLREHREEIQENVLQRMKADPSLTCRDLTDEERAGHLPSFLDELARLLESADPEQLDEYAIQSGRCYGTARYRAGCEIASLVTESMILDSVVMDLVRNHLLMLDTSNLVLDLKHFNHGLELKLKEAIQAFWRASTGKAAA